MAEVGLAFLSASLNVLFDRMASPEVADLMRGRKQTEKLSRKLKTAMRSVNAVLADAEEKQLTDPLVKDWVDDLKDVLFDAEDILDEIATEALQRKLDAESSTTAEKVLDRISNIFLDTFVNEVEPKIEEVLDRLEDLTKQKDCMGLQVGVGGKQYPEQVLTSDVSESDTFGRNEDKKKIIDLLLSSDESGNERCVIAIVGMGGIGKTTLAQLAYNDTRVEQAKFNLKIWFCVSEEFVVPNVMKSIIDQSATSSASSTEDPEKLQAILKENLTGKKFLLVLDDVWSEKSRHQEFLSQLLRYGTRGSKILVTTRNESVALAMKATATHHLELLSNDDCWSLFEKHAFRNGSSNADPEIKDIGRQIVEKCKGLPLAIKAIGDLLWSESNVERWTNILKSNLWDLHMKGTDILPALRLSYKYLPSYLKRCFAYCSIFPKDYILKKDQLVLLWMAEGFLQQSEIETMEEVGNRYFDALVSRSLFQKSLETYESGFVMHDLVHDLANFVTGQFGFTRLKGDNSKEIRKMTRYLSYFHFCGSDNFVKDIEEDLYKVKQLRTFLVIDCKEWNDIKMPRAQCLKVISLSGRRQLTELFDSIGKMKHLRYLDVSNSEIRELPNSICMLYNLQTLKLSRCRGLKRLPRDMWKLINLRHLEIDQTDSLKEMPIQMGRLKCLQTLSKFIVNKHDNGSSNIGELGNLINLRGKLLIQELQNVRSAKDALDARLKDKRYLEELVLEWNPSKQVRGISENQRGVIENLQPHEKLKSLTIGYYGGRGFPDWIGHISLPSLCYLELINCPEVDSFPEGRLPSNLKQIVIRWCEKLIANWKGCDLQILPSLEWLEINGASKNVESFPGGLLLPTTLINLKISLFENLKSLDNKGFQHLTSLEELQLNWCPNLRYMPEEGFPTSLRFLYMHDCDPVLKEELKRKEGEEWLKLARVPNIWLDYVRIQGDDKRISAFDMSSPYEPPFKPAYEYY